MLLILDSLSKNGIILARKNKEDFEMNILLVQPTYPYGKEQIYLPGGLLNFGSRLINSGINAEFVDLNLDPEPNWVDYDLVGFSVLATPYIPRVINHIRKMREAGFAGPVLVGGEGVVRLKHAHFNRWFRELGNIHRTMERRNEETKRFETFIVSSDGSEYTYEELFGLPTGTFRSEYVTSMSAMLCTLSEGQLRRYLTREFSLFFSQGCAFNCKMCQAPKNRLETYRSIESLTNEVTFICKFLQKIGHPEFRVYLSNLDGTQNPEELEERLALVDEITREHGLTMHARCLATSEKTNKHMKLDPALLSRLRSHGLRIMAFGADGADKITWGMLGKRHNKMSELMEDIAATQAAGIEVELLMVTGWPKERLASRLKAVLFSLVEATRGCVIRPYLAKMKTPGGDWWRDGDPDVERLLDNVELLTRLDYAVLGSPETHPGLIGRWLSNMQYLLVIGILAPLGKCPTSPLLPIPERGVWRKIAMFINNLMPSDR